MSTPSAFVPKAAPLLIIGSLALVNLGLGILFHKSIAVNCISEFFILGIYNLLFWFLAAIPIHVWSKRWNYFDQPGTLKFHLGLALLVVLLNVAFGQLVLRTSMICFYGCPISPSFDLLNAVFTNNLAVNLACYFALSTFFAHYYASQKDGSSSAIHPMTQPLPMSTFQIQDSKGMEHWVSPDAIIFVQSSNNCIIIHTEEGKFVKYQSLKAFLNQFSGTRLHRVHRSFAVNLDVIKRIRKNKNGDGWIELNNGAAIKMSRNYPIP